MHSKSRYGSGYVILEISKTYLPTIPVILFCGSAPGFKMYSYFKTVTNIYYTYDLRYTTGFSQKKLVKMYFINATRNRSKTYACGFKVLRFPAIM